MEPSRIFEGIVTAGDWDENGTVIGYTLATYQDEEYRLGGAVALPQLSQMVHKQVRVCGTLEQDASGRFLLLVEQIVAFS